MAVLKQAGLVDHRKDSRWVYYRLPDKKREGNFVGKLINLTISALKSDERVEDDNAKMIKITSEGLDALCKRKRGLSVFKDGGKFRGKNA
jgi:DNA-binding transcriptional ArsR family regulator